ncbi:MAG: DUF177 domain-containing protein [Betaproteobacteria bacterium]|nr:DUF177 domain-containing protein [Betaproteobacteria bacterium]
MPRSPRPSAAKALNPLRLDLAAVADRGEPLTGEWPLGQFVRLQEVGEPTQPAEAQLHWHATAEYRPVRGGQPELWLHLTLNTTVQRTCQRCLQPVALSLALERDFLFAPTEAQAQAWDAERDDADVLVLSPSLNLLELAEDEILLALPLVPRHDICPQPLVAPTGEPRAQGQGAQLSPVGAKSDNPFAILAQLKRRH